MSPTQQLAQFGDPTSRETALAMDAADPLAHYKSQFFIADQDLCYLDGNSLGRMPKATIDKVNHYLPAEWGTELVDGWGHWIVEAQVAGNLLGRATLGAAEGQTLVQDTTSVNFYQLCVAAIKARPGRKTVIIDSSNFPTDRYIIAGIAESMGLNLITLNNDGFGGPGAVEVDSGFEMITTEILEPLLNNDIALVTLQAIHYRSGSRPDIKAITDLVRSHGGLVVWDASHAGGAIDLQFDDWGVDLAVGCTYKYGNSGPGAPAWLYVRKELQTQFLAPIQGWFANDKQFVMGPFFEAAEHHGCGSRHTESCGFLHDFAPLLPADFVGRYAATHFIHQNLCPPTRNRIKASNVQPRQSFIDRYSGICGYTDHLCRRKRVTLHGREP
jgi:kynureninase